MRLMTITNPSRLPRGEVHRFLWDMLFNRPSTANISHKKMPTWEEHVKFVDHHPYREWAIIIDADQATFDTSKWVGNIYLSKQNEIGIFIKPDAQRRGFGTEAVRRIMTKYGPGDFLFNVAPDNKASALFFTRLGAKLIQHTFRLEA